MTSISYLNFVILGSAEFGLYIVLQYVLIDHTYVDYTNLKLLRQITTLITQQSYTGINDSLTYNTSCNRPKLN